MVELYDPITLHDLTDRHRWVSMIQGKINKPINVFWRNYQHHPDTHVEHSEHLVDGHASKICELSEDRW